MEASPHQRMASPWPGLSGAILFPTDFGRAAEGAWPYVLALGRLLALPVKVLHVVEVDGARCVVSPMWGSLRRRGLLRWAMRGRVAEWVGRFAPCPVLTVPEGSGRVRREQNPDHREAVVKQPKAA